MKKIPIILLFLLVITLLALPTVVNQKNQSSITTNPIDSDNDGYSDDFETDISKTDPLVSNDRYALLLNAVRNRWDNSEERDFTDFLLENKVPSENIINLFSLNATKDNLLNSLTQLSEKVDENDTLIISILTHGSEKIMCTFKTGLLAEQVNTGDLPETNDINEWELYNLTTYVELDSYLDNINAKAIILIINNCGNQEPPVFEALKDNNRVLIAAYSKGGQLFQIMELLGCPSFFVWIFESHPGLNMTEIPQYKWLLENYNSTTAIWKDADLDQNHYISLHEALVWMKKMAIATVFEEPDKPYNYYESFKTDNLEIHPNIYLNEFSPTS